MRIVAQWYWDLSTALVWLVIHTVVKTVGVQVKQSFSIDHSFIVGLYGSLALNSAVLLMCL